MKKLENDIVTSGGLAVVVGSGASGLGAARLLQLMGAKVRVLDKKGLFGPDFQENAREHGWELIGGEHSPEQFRGAEIVVPSPGVPFKILEPLLAAAGTPPWMSELELAARFTPESTIAVTGTSGKTTTTSLIAAMLKEAGKKVFLGGNIGTPLSEYVLGRQAGTPAAEVVVLEVSSFQLQGCRLFHPHVGLLLNLSANHLDQHKDMDEYRESKLNLFRCQGHNDIAIFGPELLEEARKRHLPARVMTFADSGRFRNTALLGQHNQLNIEAAFLAVRDYVVNLEQARRAAAEFKPLPHRLETVAVKDGIRYVNDSKCTTVAALRVALESFDCPVLLLAGGVFKGGDLESLVPLIQSRVKAVGLYGGNRQVFEKAWSGSVPITWNEKLLEALRALNGLAAEGDTILLAPATSSYDQYKNYLERGDHFRELVKQLAGEPK